jgi:hypothetical protein
MMVSRRAQPVNHGLAKKSSGRLRNAVSLTYNRSI